MTRKDYNMIAAAMYSAQPPFIASVEQHERYQLVCRALADKLASDNPRFDRAKFLKACGVES